MPSEPRVHPQENVTAMDTFRAPLLNSTEGALGSRLAPMYRVVLPNISRAGDHIPTTSVLGQVYTVN